MTKLLVLLGLLLAAPAWAIEYEGIGGGGGSPGAGAPEDAGYIVTTPDGDLTNEFALDSLGDGLLLNNGTTGEPSIYAGDACVASFVRALDASGVATCEEVTLGTDTDGGYAGSLTEGGAATTATALAADPSDCGANQFANAIAASGNLTCAQVAFSDLSGSATDAQIPNTITIDLATAATALASNPDDCGANSFANAIAANGNLTCAQPAFSDLSGSATDAQIPNNITVTLAATATALASNPTDCGPNEFAELIDASGNLDCSAPDHGALTGLTDDDHSQYLLLAGRAGTANDPIISTGADGTIYGSDDAGGNLTIAGNDEDDLGAIILDSRSTIIGSSMSGELITSPVTLIEASSLFDITTGGGAYKFIDHIPDITIDTTIPVSHIYSAGGSWDFNGLSGSVPVYQIFGFNIDWSLISNDGWIRYQDGFVDQTQITYSGTTDMTTVTDNPWFPYSFVSLTKTSTTSSGDYRIEEAAGMRFRPQFDSAHTDSTLTIDRLAAVSAGPPEAIAGGGCSSTDGGQGGCTITEYAIVLADMTAPAAGSDQSLGANMTIDTLYGMKLDDFTAGSGTITNKRSLWSEGADVHMIHAGNVGIGDGTDVPSHTLEVGGGQGAMSATTAIMTDGAASYNVTGTISGAWLQSEAAITTGSADSFLGSWSAFRRAGSFTTTSTTETNAITRYLFLDQDAISTSVDDGPAGTWTVGALPTISSSFSRTNANDAGAFVASPTISSTGTATFVQTNVYGLDVRPRLLATTNNAVTVTNYYGFRILDPVAGGSGGTETITNLFGVDIPSFSRTTPDVTNAVGIRNADATVFTPPSVATLADEFTIDPNSKTFYEVTSTGAVDSAATAISDGEFPGQVLIIANTGTNNIQIDDAANTDLGPGGSGVDANCTLAAGDTLTVVWSATESNWLQIACTGT